MTDAARERVIRWEEPVAAAQAARTMSGLEALRAIRDGGVSQPPIAVLMNIWLTDIEEGRVVFEGDPAEYHYNPIGVVHGGFALTIADSALGCAVHSMLPAGVGYTSTDIQLRYIRAITKDTGRVRCEARTLHVGRTTGVSEARLTDANGKLLATATMACAIFRPAPTPG